MLKTKNTFSGKICILVMAVISYSYRVQCLEGPICINYDYLLKSSIDLWTNIDLVRAINISVAQKESFLKEIVKDIITLYTSYVISTTTCMIDDLPKDSFAIMLTEIQQSYHEIFNSIDNVGFFAIGDFVLNKLLHMLKTPCYIKSE